MPLNILEKDKKDCAFNGMTQEELWLSIKTRGVIERGGEANYHILKDIARVLNLPLEKLQDNEDIGQTLY